MNNEPCKARPFRIDLNPAELKYYRFIIFLNKFSESCNIVDDISTKICIPSKANYVNVKAFNVRANKNEAKTLVKHTSCDCKCKFNSTACNSNEKWNNNKCQCKCKSYHKCKKYYRWNPN